MEKAKSKDRHGSFQHHSIYSVSELDFGTDVFFLFFFKLKLLSLGYMAFHRAQRLLIKICDCVFSKLLEKEGEKLILKAPQLIPLTT